MDIIERDNFPRNRPVIRHVTARPGPHSFRSLFTHKQSVLAKKKINDEKICVLKCGISIFSLFRRHEAFREGYFLQTVFFFVSEIFITQKPGVMAE